MGLRCVLFSSDTGVAEAICQVLADLGIEGEHCQEAVAAVEKVCKESFQIVIVDWDQQPEAGALLQAVRERKATARPLTLAIVSDEANVAKAVQAGANSILRKPIVAKQVTDTLARARDLLRARESAAQAAAAGAAGAAAAAATASAPGSSVSANLPERDATLRAGEFLVSAAPATQFDTESEMQKSLDQAAGQNVDPLTDLEPMASPVVQKNAKNAQKTTQKNVLEPPPVEPAPEPPASDGPRGLQWYLDQRAAKLPPATLVSASAPSPSDTPVKPELLGFDQPPSQPAPAWGKPETPTTEPPPFKEQEKKAAELFAYIAGEYDEPEKGERPSRRLGKKAILIALALAACATVAAPQAPWSPQVHALWARGHKSLHAWLNPQPVTPERAPASHENFGRAGDEYKLPVAETIPDATTDPSQIRVTPMVDPTAKKPNTGADPNLAPPDAAGNTGVPPQSPGMSTTQSTGQGAASSSDAQPANGQVSNAAQGSQNNSGSGANAGNANPESSGAGSQPSPPATAAANNPSSAPSANPSSGPSDSNSSPAPAQPAAPKTPQPSSATTATTTSNASIPSSLKSQIGSMTPDASGNKLPETALPSIEPVPVPEAAERALALDQPAIAYPASAKGQQGTVTLQVLIGRDGTVQDAKFLQGSLAFAKAAIDGVKPWKFKPYVMNGRPVSVQTNLTIGFKPQ
jgi:TonB family protein